MTIPEFLDLLRSRHDEQIWVLATHRDRGRVLIRALDDGDGLCPIAFLAGKHSWEYCSGGTSLGLRQADIYAIVDAVDAWPGYDPVLRAQIMAAVGLEGEGVWDGEQAASQTQSV